MTALVGITGFAGAGKDTAAEALVADGWRRDAFADRMRAGLLAIDPYVIDGFGSIRLSALIHLHGWDIAKREYPEVRRLLQRFGTEAGRAIHGQGVWVKAVLRDWLDGGERPTVITDVRFDNEAEMIRECGGIVVAVWRPGVGSVNGHASDAGIDPTLVDVWLGNDGTVAELHARMLEIVGRS